MVFRAIVVSFWSVRLLRTSMPPGWTVWVPGWNGIVVDGTVLTFAILLTVFVGLASGFSVALHAVSLARNGVHAEITCEAH